MARCRDRVARAMGKLRGRLSAMKQPASKTSQTPTLSLSGDQSASTDRTTTTWSDLPLEIRQDIIERVLASITVTSTTPDDFVYAKAKTDLGCLLSISHQFNKDALLPLEREFLLCRARVHDAHARKQADEQIFQELIIRGGDVTERYGTSSAEYAGILEEDEKRNEKFHRAMFDKYKARQMRDLIKGAIKTLKRRNGV